MAHRLLIRRLWNVPVKEIRCLSASTAPTSSTFPVVLQSTKNGISFLSASHPITLMSHRRASFNVQDMDDFKEKVIDSEIPVLIDFHAQWVLERALIVDRKMKYSRFFKVFLLWCVGLWTEKILYAYLHDALNYSWQSTSNTNHTWPHIPYHSYTCDVFTV